MNPKHLCFHYRTDKLEGCSTCCGATNMCGLYESEVNPFHSRQPLSVKGECKSNRNTVSLGDSSADTNSQRKKDVQFPLANHLEPRSRKVENKIQGVRTWSADTHADTYYDNLTMISKEQRKLMLRVLK